MWNGKQNVRITYRKIEGQTTSGSKRMPDLDDLVEYQKAGATKVSSVRGVSRPVDVDGTGHGLAYSWRGKGWLKIASSNWEILGWGKEEARAGHPEGDWVVTYFSKTLFTPAGLDIYCRSNRPLADVTLKTIKHAIASLGEPSLVGLAKSIFEVPRTEIPA
jgi:hypothetical protein